MVNKFSTCQTMYLYTHSRMQLHKHGRNPNNSQYLWIVLIENVVGFECEQFACWFLCDHCFSVISTSANRFMYYAIENIHVSNCLNATESSSLCRNRTIVMKTKAKKEIEKNNVKKEPFCVCFFRPCYCWWSQQFKRIKWISKDLFSLKLLNNLKDFRTRTLFSCAGSTENWWMKWAACQSFCAFAFFINCNSDNRIRNANKLFLLLLFSFLLHFAIFGGKNPTEMK